MPSRMGWRYINEYTEDRLRDMEDEPEKAVTVNVMVDEGHRGKDLSDIKEILRDG